MLMEKIANSDGNWFQCSVCCTFVDSRLSFISHMDSHREESSNSEADQTFYTDDGVYQLSQLQTSSLQVYIPKIALTRLEHDYEDKLISLFENKNSVSKRSHSAPSKAKFRRDRSHCLFCKVHLKWNETRSSHLPQCTSKPDFVCGVCGNCLPTAATLAAHMRLIHLSARKYACSFCPSRFAHIRGLKRHYRQTPCKKLMVGKNLKDLVKQEPNSLTSSSRDRDTKASAEDQNATQWFSCGLSCPAKFKTPGELARHAEVFHHTAPNYKCEFCDKPCPTLEALNRHLKRTCLRKIANGKTPVSYHHQNEICAYCKESFTSGRQLSAHVRNVCKQKKDASDAEAYRCQHCEKSFVSLKYLRKHCQYVCLPKLSGEGSLRHICDNCGMTFTQKRSLLIHVQRKVCMKKVANLKLKGENNSDTESVPIAKHEIKQEISGNGYELNTSSAYNPIKVKVEENVKLEQIA